MAAARPSTQRVSLLICSPAPLFRSATHKTAPGNGTSDARWVAAYNKAAALVAQLTLDEKVNLTFGHPFATTPGAGTALWPRSCAGNSLPIERLGLPSFCFADAPDGVRGAPDGSFNLVSGFPAGMHVAATFDSDLLLKYGEALGREYLRLGVTVALGPVAGPLGRIARGGRNWEALGNDPYLAGIGMGQVTRGIQSQGVVATPKHFLFNEQEFRRRDSARQSEPENIVGEAISSNVDDRTLHELYAFPFMDALAAGAGAVMCSYQRSNHSYGCQNSKLLNGIIKTEFGFEGVLLSDWDAQHSGVASALAGLDIVMPNSKGYWADGLLNEAVNNGSVPLARLDDMVTRLLAAKTYVVDGAAKDKGEIKQLGSDLADFSVFSTQDDAAVSREHAKLIREIGAAGTVLVKNVNNTLPLRNPRYLTVYGYDAVVKGNPWDDPARFGGGYDVNKGWNILNGTLITGGGSGGATPPYVVSPFQALQEKVTGQGGGVLRWDFKSDNPPTASRYNAYADACLVFINGYASESFDRPSLTDAFSDRLVNNIAATCNNTIVVVHSAGIRVVDDWFDHPNVTAVVYGGLPGQESGHSLVDVLYGDVNPSGRLTFTVAHKEEDYGSLLNSSYSLDYFPDADFEEGLFVDYRAFDRSGIEPRFAFGFGLSYTTFGYGKLEVQLKAKNTTEFPSPDVPVVQGGHPELWDTVAVVHSDVTNTGTVAGAEVAQLYIGVPAEDDPDAPVRVLRGFAKKFLKPKQTATAEFVLTRRDLSVWDVVAQQWRLRRGTYRLYVGASSRDLRLTGSLVI